MVTKFFPASDVRVLADLGVRHVGENRHQEAEAKAAECADLDLTWHYIGGLQSNKAAAVAAYADVVESVDRAKLLSGLSRGAHQRSPRPGLSGPGQPRPARRGRRPGRRTRGPAARPAADLASRGMLRLRGLMAVAPLDEDPVAAFSRLAAVRRDFLADHPDATWLSAGMSGDLEAAIGCGATHVRIGRAVLGERPRIK